MRVRENTGPRSMSSLSTNSDIDPDTMSGYFPFSGDLTVSGHKSGHHVRIPPKHLILGAETQELQSPSRHFSRQNGEWETPERRFSGDPAVYPAILRDPLAPGIVLFLNRVKPETRQGQVFLVNASQIFEKGDPKNFIADAGR